MTTPNLRIIPDNLADTATLTASPAVAATLPVTNLQLSLRSRVMRTTSTVDQQIKGTWASAQMLSGAVIWRHNLTSAGTWKLELFSDAAWTTKVYDSGDVVSWPAKAWGEFIWGVDPLGANVFTGWGKAFSAMWFSPTAAQSFRITFKDATNSAGYLEVGRLFLGLHLEPLYNMSYDHALEWVDDSKQERTDGTSLHTDAVEQYRRFKFRLDWLTDSERPKWLEAFRVAGKTKDIFISAYPTQGGMKERDYSFSARITSPTPMPNSRYNAHKVEITIEES